MREGGKMFNQDIFAVRISLYYACRNFSRECPSLIAFGLLCCQDVGESRKTSITESRDFIGFHIVDKCPNLESFVVTKAAQANITVPHRQG